MNNDQNLMSIKPRRPVVLQLLFDRWQNHPITVRLLCSYFYSVGFTKITIW